ncbi:ABC transporter ATP-binding protein [Methylocystis bryophila]|uniref:ABC transporter ATP-binding protein n=1 Tax=Methylocystis bryophila TaxID=655015 RepID=A0A1W6MYR8_9HYPH|nr:ATP-binding cassette domain-containing protein [Methylocystis bryophila]ARN82703.1 ABC transporter ATP-binding protein [Methylocystis bryophila]BDV38930.1 ABC transporter ATP-binding protein [Methylocystis bryophila]
MLLDVDIAAKEFLSPDGRKTTVIGGLRFALARGEAGALVGPSGCGKTTLLRIIAGLDADFSGRVSLPRGSRLGMAFQEPRLLPWRSVFDNLKIAAPDASDAEIDALLAGFDLAAHRDEFPGRLSLGLARRAALARALAIHPTLLLLDEPLVSLDAALALELRERIARLIDETHVTTLIVTHDLNEAIALADRIFILTPRPTRVAATLAIATPRGKMTEGRARHYAEEAKAMISRLRAP